MFDVSIRRLSTTVAVLGFVLFSTASTALFAADDVLVLEHHTLKDAASRDMPSHTLLAPKGWSVEGGAYWANPKLFRVHPSRQVTVTGPDGRFVKVSPLFSATDFFPSPQMQQLGARRPQQGKVDAGVLVIWMPASLDEWQAWVKEHGIERPFPEATNIKMDEVEVVPELTKLLHRMMEPHKRRQAQENQQAAALGSSERGFLDAAAYAVRATYKLDGKTWEQSWVWAISVVGQDAQVGRQIWWTMEPVVTFRAPKGELAKAMPLMMTVANSIRPTPQWAQLKARHIARMQQIDVEAFVKRSLQQAQFSHEMNAIIDETWKNTQATRDTGHHHFIQGIRETQHYTLPNSNDPPVQLPMHYKHVWQSENGKVILTNDANYNPGTGDTEIWRQMERAK